MGAGQEEWLRLFMAPGVAHCRGGVGPDQIDFLGALDTWREAGEAPSSLTASRSRDGRIDMTRPLCPYPQIARWNGTGDTTDARNFVCAAP
jgi:feruloyl esterase